MSKPLKPSGCANCTFIEREDNEGYGYYDYCTERPSFSNLKSFPFKKEMPCFIPAFWCSEFSDLVGEDDDFEDDTWQRTYSEQAAKYSAKYFPKQEKKDE